MPPNIFHHPTIGDSPLIIRTLILLAIGLLTGTITAMSAGSGVMIVVPLLVMLSG